MRQFNKIFVISLPRCATVSVTQALGMLGIRIAHLGRIFGEQQQTQPDLQQLKRIWRQIEVNDYDLDILRICQGLADYPACSQMTICRLDQQFPGSLFINVRRDDCVDRWLQSVETQFVGTELLLTQMDTAGSSEQEQLMQVLRCFRKITFGSESFDATLYRKAYLAYQSWVAEYFAKRHDLLDFTEIDQLTSNGFSRLCHFLEIERVPKSSFPSSNVHSQLPRQNFMRALRSGKIHSRTGIEPEYE